MKIFVTGTRGIPNIPGGVEKHCQELYPRIAARGHEVVLATRSPYVADEIPAWRGVRLVRCFAPRKKSLEALVHTLVALVKARRFHPDVVHIHAIGPSLLTPLARLIGFPVVVTNHGPEYDRQKWGAVAKAVLRVGEKVGGAWANEVIVVSNVIREIVERRCRRATHVIYNGVTPAVPARGHDLLDDKGITPDNYVLAVARFVPEKGLHDLMEAFKGMNEGQQQLVIAGDADHESAYSRQLRQMAEKDRRIVLTGYITGELLRQAYSHARLFVLPSYHEGLPIVLLEALSYGLPLLVSDIPANKAVGLPARHYFQCGDVGDLQKKMEALLGNGISGEERESMKQMVREKYDWENIADQTIEVYRQAVSPPFTQISSRLKWVKMQGMGQVIKKPEQKTLDSFTHFS